MAQKAFKPLITTGLFFRRIKKVLVHPLFAGLTVAGNLVMATGATAFFFLERNANPNVHSFMDALWWSVSTVTTVGYGDITPHTTIGRVIGMLMMIFGVALFSSFTALFASHVVMPEISHVEKELEGIEKQIEKVESDESRIEDLIVNLEKNLDLLKKAAVKKV